MLYHYAHPSRECLLQHGRREDSLWSLKKLCDLYEKQSAASQIYWLKKLVDLKMKEGTPMSNHLNEFHTIFSQLTAQEVQFQDSV